MHPNKGEIGVFAGHQGFNLLVRHAPRWGMSGAARKSTANAANESGIALTVRLEPLVIGRRQYLASMTRSESVEHAAMMAKVVLGQKLWAK